MLKKYLYKCLIVLSLFTLSISLSLSNENTEQETSASKRPHEETVVPSDSQAKKPEEPILTKRPRIESEEEREASEDEEEEPKSPITPLRETLIEESAGIGTWVGDEKRGIETFRLSYKGVLLSKEIKDWHLAMGRQIEEIVTLIGPTKDSTNYIRARIDLVYKVGETYEATGASIPILFLSGYNDANAKRKALRLQRNISHISPDPCISISSYFGWESLWKENYKPIRKKLEPFFIKASAKDRLSDKFLQAEQESLMHSNEHAFQFWLHSEEPILLYIMGHPARKANGESLSPTFSEIMHTIKLPKDIIPELCILSMVSRNDCCTHCRPLLFEALEHKDFLDKSLTEGVGINADILLGKVLLYSALYSFGIKRPTRGYSEELNIEAPDTPLFLMAGNAPTKEQ
ncbi:hypothetical protein [Candidatus Odyssella thessalonicensis]|uniref:hypothetical protein n=1 Tax=Candidatus Odyssella thessalonicensis TaxID=84647 RepID=UPI001FDF3669|nr:hypothetical protein [Candidatus Odyssella thessalonicensis]